MNYSYTQVVFQEVPSEVTLALSISGCQLKCIGCHSAFTWDNKYGEELTEEVLSGLLNKYKGLITTVLFYGGEWESNLIPFINIIKDSGVKFCLYTGLTLDELSPDIRMLCDYIKVGRYEARLGGLNEPTTNQRMYKRVAGGLEDITYKFWWK